MPCARLSWPFRQLLRARKYSVLYGIVKCGSGRRCRSVNYRDRIENATTLVLDREKISTDANITQCNVCLDVIIYGRNANDADIAEEIGPSLSSSSSSDLLQATWPI